MIISNKKDNIKSPFKMMDFCLTKTENLINIPRLIQNVKEKSLPFIPEDSVKCQKQNSVLDFKTLINQRKENMKKYQLFKRMIILKPSIFNSSKLDKFKNINTIQELELKNVIKKHNHIDKKSRPKITKMKSFENITTKINKIVSYSFHKIKSNILTELSLKCSEWIVQVINRLSLQETKQNYQILCSEIVEEQSYSLLLYENEILKEDNSKSLKRIISSFMPNTNFKIPTLKIKPIKISHAKLSMNKFHLIKMINKFEFSVSEIKMKQYKKEVYENKLRRLFRISPIIVIVNEYIFINTMDGYNINDDLYIPIIREKTYFYTKFDLSFTSKSKSCRYCQTMPCLYYNLMKSTKFLSYYKTFSSKLVCDLTFHNSSNVFNSFIDSNNKFLRKIKLRKNRMKNYSKKDKKIEKHIGDNYLEKLNLLNNLYSFESKDCQNNENRLNKIIKEKYMVIENDIEDRMLQIKYLIQRWFKLYQLNATREFPIVSRTKINNINYQKFLNLNDQVGKEKYGYFNDKQDFENNNLKSKDLDSFLNELIIKTNNIKKELDRKTMKKKIEHQDKEESDICNNDLTSQSSNEIIEYNDYKDLETCSESVCNELKSNKSNKKQEIKNAFYDACSNYLDEYMLKYKILCDQMENNIKIKMSEMASGISAKPGTSELNIIQDMCTLLWTIENRIPSNAGGKYYIVEALSVIKRKATKICLKIKNNHQCFFKQLPKFLKCINEMGSLLNVRIISKELINLAQSLSIRYQYFCSHFIKNCILLQYIYVPNTSLELFASDKRDRRIWRIENMCHARTYLLGKNHSQFHKSPLGYRTLEIVFDPIKGLPIGFIQALRSIVPSIRLGNTHKICLELTNQNKENVSLAVTQDFGFKLPHEFYL